MDDTQRLDAIGEYGLIITTHDMLVQGSWKRVWKVIYGDCMVTGPTLRAVIDAAVLDLNTENTTTH